ncbi:PDR/VanB family oxidoreductase [Paraburkholderia bryophila]|uniref:Vanillate O-demethylase ferredoxin subunit n=1 Tax=Paraburkholderia bryophila TaxID=420952 RepID=A0A7Y9W4E6_9BURK|nr:PDR/VanB family oxidoreductase [Paraburkholderia bryophila]NYH14069.1 vanillate O-demethylase ferredoxin subunit [Paraburkholderia bryophila]
MNTIPVRVVAAETIAEGIRLLKLAPLDGSMLPAWEPGSHIDLHLDEGITRQYSLCGSHTDTSAYEVAVKREIESRGGSKFVHESLRVGSELSISAPRNHFRMSAESGHSLLVAGGIGITPIVSMARLFHDQSHPFELLYFTRSESHAAFRDELDSGPLNGSCRLLFGQERDAVETILDDALRNRREGGHLYLCGPQPFMDTVRMVAARHGWPDDAVHLEYFAAGVAADTEPQTSFDVKLARSGKTFTIAADQTIVDVLREHGTDVETSCEQGICGTCVVNVLEGCPDHRDYFLTAKEHERGDCMAICVSRSRSKLLVIDL